MREDSFTALEIVGYLGIIGYYLCLWFAPEFQLMELLGSLVLIMFVYVFTYPKFHAEQVTGGDVWYPVCGRDAVLYFPDTVSGGRRFTCMADLFCFLGLRYLCLLCGQADR